MKAIAVSQKGTRSEHNEDACLAMPTSGVFVVSDGVGGGPSGQVASRSVVEKIYQYLHSSEVTQERIEQAIEMANSKVMSVAKQRNIEGTACTLVLAWVDGSKLTCFNVGDSRIYRLRDGKVTQLTKDHTKLVDRGSRKKRVVTRVLGLKENIPVDISEWDWKPTDMVMLMSDGISDPLAVSDIERIVVSEKLSVGDKVKSLITESVTRGCEDDKTIVVAFQ